MGQRNTTNCGIATFVFGATLALSCLQCMPVPPLRSPNLSSGAVTEMTGIVTSDGEGQTAEIRKSNGEAYTHDLDGSEIILLQVGYSSEKRSCIRASLLSLPLYVGNVEWNRKLFVYPKAVWGKGLYGSLLLSANANLNIAAENMSQSAAASLPLGIPIGWNFEFLLQPSVSFSRKSIGYLPGHNGTAGKLKRAYANIGTGIIFKPKIRRKFWFKKLWSTSEITAGVTFSQPIWETSSLDPTAGKIINTSYPRIYPQIGATNCIRLNSKKRQ